MDVSFIIPALNEEKVIEKTLKSIKGQKTKLKTEIIVCDGDSKDNTVKIAKKYGKITKKIGRSIASARNIGASEAKGKFFLFIDADTILPNDYLEKVTKVMNENKELVAVTANIIYPGGIRAKFFQWTTNLMNTIAAFGKGFLIGPNMFVRREAFKKVKGFEELPSEDYHFYRSLKKVGKVRYIYDTYCISSSRRLQAGILGIAWYYLVLVLTTSLVSSRFKFLRKFGYKINGKYKPVR